MPRHLRFFMNFLALIALTTTAAFADQPAPAFLLENFKDGEELRYSVPILRGTVPDKAATAVTLTNLTSSRDTRQIEGLALEGKFKVLADLLPGRNELLLKCGEKELKFALVFKPQTNPYFVRAIYVTDNTGDTTYQTLDPKDPQNYAAKMSTALLIMQSFTAERMNDLGFGRRTFNVELDENGRVKVHLFKGPAPAETYYKMNDQAWYANIAARLEPLYPIKQAKNFVVAAYTRFDPVTKKMNAHTALGGGGQGLFGSGSMFTWPSELKDVQPAFMNATRIDKEKIMDDSAGRNTFWGAASTTIGACLHEIGHAFGLPHTREPLDIMTRGFDRFNRAFTFVDPPSGQNKDVVAFKPDRVGCFAPISAAYLQNSRWFTTDARAWDDATGVRIEKVGDEIVCEASAGLRYVSFAGKEGEAFFHATLAEGTTLRVPAAKLGDAEKEGDVLIRALDAHGNATLVRVSELKRGPFVQDWQFAPQTQPWADREKYPNIDDAARAKIEAAAKQTPIRSSSSREVALGRVFPGDIQNVAAYALRTIHVEKETKLKVFTGSDDGLRLWVNGKLAQGVLAIRGTKIDSESAEISLQPGENTLLVEVMQGKGGWGFVLRLEDADGKKMKLTVDGKLERGE